MESTADNPTKTVILQKALNLFAEKGYESVGVQELCTVCGVTKPTLYYYFTSKLGLFQAILESEGKDFLSVVAEASEYAAEEMEGETFHATLNSLMAAILEFAHSHEDFFKLYCSLSASLMTTESQESFSLWKKQFDAVFDSLFETGAGLFGNMRGFESLYARMFQSTACYSVSQAVSGHLNLNEETISRITHAFLWGVAS